MSLEEKSERNQYLSTILPKYIEPTSVQMHWFYYQAKRLKRFVLHFLLFFICQFIAIGCVSFKGIVPPMYPPMGVAFVILYLFGWMSIFALFFADICAYLLQNFSIESLIFYLVADIVPAIVVTSLWKNMFKTDDFESNQWQVWFRFILITMFFTCLLSACIRLSVFYFYRPQLSYSAVFYRFIQLWFADINGVIILFSFLISWLYFMYSRSLVLKGTVIIKKTSFWLFLFCLGFALGSLKSFAFCYWILASMLLSFYLTYQSGMVLGTAFMYGISFLYFAYFTVQREDFIFHYGLKFYTLISIVLFIYNISILCAANVGRGQRIVWQKRLKT